MLNYQRVFEESWIEWTWVNGFHRWCPKPSKGSEVKVPTKRVSFTKWAFSAKFRPLSLSQWSLECLAQTNGIRTRWPWSRLCIEKAMQWRRWMSSWPWRSEAWLQPWLFGGCLDVWPQLFFMMAGCFRKFQTCFAVTLTFSSYHVISVFLASLNI